jgi:hypothetical protein
MVAFACGLAGPYEGCWERQGECVILKRGPEPDADCLRRSAAISSHISLTSWRADRSARTRVHMCVAGTHGIYTCAQ